MRESRAVPHRRGGQLVEQAQYAAFLSYSHRDRRLAAWLHRALENYTVPAYLVGTQGPTGEVPRRLRPVFRDRDELPASDDLGTHIETALSMSRALVVLCSPPAARSHWTNQEIATFKRLNPGRPILAAIIAGEPYASDTPGREDEECFPPALREKFDAQGHPTGERAEPIAADFRTEADGRRLGKLKVIAGMLGVGLNDLVRRDTARRNRRMAWLATGSLTGMALTSGLALFAFNQRAEAVRQREQADGLIEFMLTDLRKKLEPVGRLDVLDSVGEKALAYYRSQDLAALNADALGRRARALQLVGEVASVRGNLGRALPLFRQAAAATAEQLRRDPENGQRLFDHAQSVYWVGNVAWTRGDYATAHNFFTQYRDYAAKLFERKGSEGVWKAELGHAETNLGVVALDRGDPRAALGHFERAGTVWNLLHAGAPDNSDYAYQGGQALAWEADSRRKLGENRAALANRREEIAVYERILARDPADTKARFALSVAQLRVAQLYLGSDAPARALSYGNISLEGMRRLEARDPSNGEWQEVAVKAANVRTEALMRAGDWRLAEVNNAWALEHARSLVATDPSVTRWRADCLMPARWLEIAIDQRLHGAAAARAGIARFNRDYPGSGDPTSEDERFARVMVRALAGLNWRILGDRARSQGSFQQAMRLLPEGDTAMRARMAAVSGLVGEGSMSTAAARAEPDGGAEQGNNASPAGPINNRSPSPFRAE